MTIFAVQKTGMENGLFLVWNRVTIGQPGGKLLTEIPGNTYPGGGGGGGTDSTTADNRTS